MSDIFTINLDQVPAWRRQALRDELIGITENAMLEGSLYTRILGKLPVYTTEDNERAMAISISEAIREYIRDARLSEAIAELFTEKGPVSQADVKELDRLLDLAFSLNH